VAVCDAETEADLIRLARSALSLEAPLLWCGTGGLARALGAPIAVPASHLNGRWLIVVGSRHPVAEGQARRLHGKMTSSAAIVRGFDDAAPAVHSIKERFGAGGSSALLFALPPIDPPVAEAVFRATFARLAEIPPPDVLIAVGGDTLFRLCEEIGAESLEAIGEWSPGIAVARIAGGGWSGTTLISKSGAFGDGDLLVRLWENEEELPRRCSAYRSSSARPARRRDGRKWRSSNARNPGVRFPSRASAPRRDGSPMPRWNAPSATP
jgi:uncharacterized protein YgbK (DUF1537 family)